MSSFVILATNDTQLSDTWAQQLPQGKIALRINAQSLSTPTTPGMAAVVVLDSAAESILPAGLGRCPTIYVGEPRSLPFEQARLAGRAKVYFSYDDSRSRLVEVLPLLEELAEKQSMLELLSGKSRRLEPTRVPVRSNATDGLEFWDFVEGAVENLDSVDRLVAEFRRAARHLMRASHAVFFFREADGFRADLGTSFFPLSDPLVLFFENSPAVVDGSTWDGPDDPIAELAIRNRLALWGARLLIPVHDNGRLMGLIALGVRNDGQPYDGADRNRAVFFARLFRHFVSKSGQIARLRAINDQVNIGAKYLPTTLILGPNEAVPRHIPVVIREIIGHTRKVREISRISPSDGQPFRASAGIVGETGGVWAYWEEASSELHDANLRQRSVRRSLLRELSLTLSHELGNALVSLTMFRQIGLTQPLPDALLSTVKNDVGKLEALNRSIELIQNLHEAVSEMVDMRDLARSMGQSLGFKVEIGPDPVVVGISKNLVEFAFRSLVATIAENRGELGYKDLSLQVRSTGAGSDSTALLSIKGRNLELEGILPEPMEGAVPNQGRLGVFIAKEVLRLHRGEIHAGPGMEGTEILISLRSL